LRRTAKRVETPLTWPPVRVTFPIIVPPTVGG
jgi:hypothetical protein